MMLVVDKDEESVRLIPLIYQKVVANPNVNKRPNTPHSTDMGYKRIYIPLPHNHIKNECCPFALTFRKLPHSLIRTTKTLSYVMPDKPTPQR